MSNKITYKPWPIPDTRVQELLNTVEFKPANVQEFKSMYKDWILSSKHTVYTGLENYSTSLTDGVTGAFSDFTHAYPHRRTVVFKGEYPYHRDTGAHVIDIVDQIAKSDKVIISAPFAATGNVHEYYTAIIERCDELKVPVFVDCAYFGCCKLGEINVDYECIKMVSFSLSKTFATGKCRIGITFHKDLPVVTPMQLLNEYKYVNHIAINIHLPIIQTFSPDYMFDTYRDNQTKLAAMLDVDASDTVFLCTTSDPYYKGFSRAGYINRLGVAEVIAKDNINLNNIEWVEKP